VPLDDHTAKTEKPTPRKLHKAREKGMVPRSVELAGALSFLAVLLMLRYMGGRWAASLTTFVRDGLSSAASPESVMDPSRLFLVAASNGAAVVLPVALLTAAVSGLALAAQGGMVFSLAPLAQGAARLHPLRGLGSIFSFRKFVSAGWATMRIVFAGLVGFLVAWPWLEDAFVSPARTARGMLTLGGGLFGSVLIRLAAILAALALADTLLQRWQHMKTLKMTKEEVRDERREMEGDPMIRSRQRARRLELVRRRMMAEVPMADVVVTNPTHVAVALRYDPAKMPAPRVVAKGRGHIAERIREIARKHGVPMVEDAPLARSLLRMVPLGALIPPQLYRAVAELLAYVYRLKKRRAGRI